MKNDDKSLVPTGNPNKGGLYNVPNKEESKKKISALLEKSNEMFFMSIEKPRTNIYDMEALVESTKGYLTYCCQKGVMPSFRRLANWYGYSARQLDNIIQKGSDTGVFLERLKDAIKDNLEQAALVNAVNNISAMFIMKTQHGYVEATKHIIEPSETLLGQPKSIEEIADYIDADVIEE